MDELFGGESPFRDLLPEIKTKLVNDGRIIAYENQQFVHHAGDEVKGIYAVVKGCVRISKTDENGQYILVKELIVNEWFGFIGYFGKGLRPQEAVVKGNTELLFIPKRIFDTLLLDHPQVYRHILALMADYTTGFFDNYQSAVNDSLFERIVTMLIRLQSWQDSNELSTTQQDLASFLGATREAVGGHLNKLKSEGVIDLAYRKIIIIDPQRLKAYRC